MRRNASLHAALAATALAAVALPVSAADADGPATTPTPTTTLSALPDPAASTAATGTSSPSPAPSPSGSDTPSPVGSPSPTGNLTPVAVDDTLTVRQGRTVDVDVLGNDTDPDGDPLTVASVGPAALGTVTLSDGVVQYSAPTTATGTDTFTYVVTDDVAGEATATVTVTVVPPATATLRVPARPHALQTYRIRGRVRPPLDDVADVRLLRWRDGAWSATAPVDLDPEGRFAVPWRPTLPGPVRWRPAVQSVDGSRTLGPVVRSRVVARLDAEVRRVSRADVPHSWRPGCPVAPARLRSIDMTYWDFQGRLRRGTLVGSAWAVGDYVAVFRQALAGGFQIRKLYPVDRYHGSDVHSMGADNTSAFNCRHVTGNPYRMSQHSYGDAIDINPFENPYATGSRIYPVKAAVPYYHRRERHLGDPGVITPGSAIARALFGQGWAWGARWRHHDYQHWSRNGG